MTVGERARELADEPIYLRADGSEAMWVAEARPLLRALATLVEQQQAALDAAHQRVGEADAQRMNAIRKNDKAWERAEGLEAQLQEAQERLRASESALLLFDAEIERLRARVCKEDL